MATARPRLPLSDEVISELTRRAASGLHTFNDRPDERAHTYAQYLSLLYAAAIILDAAPQSIEELEALDIEKQMENNLEIIITTIQRILPGGLKEATRYLRGPVDEEGGQASQARSASE
jgi:hypothetical protein